MRCSEAHRAVAVRSRRGCRVRCAQRTRAELAQTGPRHPVVSRFEFPLTTHCGRSPGEAHRQNLPLLRHSRRQSNWLSWGGTQTGPRRAPMATWRHERPISARAVKSRFGPLSGPPPLGSDRYDSAGHQQFSACSSRFPLSRIKSSKAPARETINSTPNSSPT